jgi:uncharacterized DUF497 family protein
MAALHVVWDLEDDEVGNLQHIAEHDVTAAEVEEVLHGSLSNTTASKSSHHRITFGYTTDGRYLAVVWEHVQDDPLTIYPVTAYDAPEPRKRRK